MAPEWPMQLPVERFMVADPGSPSTPCVVGSRANSHPRSTGICEDGGALPCGSLDALPLSSGKSGALRSGKVGDTRPAQARLRAGRPGCGFPVLMEGCSTGRSDVLSFPSAGWEALGCPVAQRSASRVKGRAAEQGGVRDAAPRAALQGGAPPRLLPCQRGTNEQRCATKHLRQHRPFAFVRLCQRAGQRPRGAGARTVCLTRGTGSAAASRRVRPGHAARAVALRRQDDGRLSGRKVHHHRLPGEVLRVRPVGGRNHARQRGGHVGL